MILEILSSNIFLNFIMIFSTIASTLWFFYYFGLYAILDRRPNKAYNGRLCLLCPVYNEDLNNLENTIKRAKENKYLDELMFVNDGSQNDVSSVLKNNLEDWQYVDNKINQGKRHAQADGIKKIRKLYGDNYFDAFVMIDSDTLIEPNTIHELKKKLAFNNVGAVTAQVLVANRTENILTRALSAMYWSSSQIWRKSATRYNYCQTTNGQLTVYRAKPIIELLPQYLTQTFLGNKCAFSDDRWFTQHLQTDYNLRIEYEERAIAYTYVPNSYRKAWKMLLRWKKGSLRETLLVTKHFFKKPLLVLDCWWNQLVAIGQLVIRLSIIMLMFVNPLVILWYLMIVGIISMIYALDMIFHDPKQIPWRIAWSWMNELYFGYLIIFAVKGIRNQGWGTRSVELINK
jgi:hyaluronan synthase